ncbi:DNA topoisomerase 3-beta-1 [Trichinella britovi]|uniref:DNA topoisomerase n=1 Tax=Trichinella britovi TaxID=45882 RepID=A0A0V1CPA9_TRIBR|nr:DNA topoisomerase 3-beta-1 [Trichinella britovi]KRY51120.1 DNA topoisomerase 3-beta-1 [Trichinella britovi]
MKVVLMVAEKPLLAKSIAEILSNGRMSTRRGFNGVCSIHEYDGDFFGQSVRFKMTSTCGHVMTMNFPKKYNDWDRVDPATLFHADVIKEEANPKLKMVNFLASEGRGVDYLVLWLDCDKEGENICFEVIDIVQPMMRHPYDQRAIYRAQFSSLAPQDILKAMSKLGRPNKLQAVSVDTRQELDLRIGCAFTRFQTRFFHEKYGNVDSKLISYGPCQTPTLGFCVARLDEMKNFKPEPYWSMRAVVTSDGGGSTMTASWARQQLFDQEVFNVLFSRAKRQRFATVVSVTTTKKQKQKPAALNTVELLRVGSSRLHLGPQQTMHLAEHLYTNGLISYPRTETTRYASNFDFHSVLGPLAKSGQFASVAQAILDRGVRMPKSGQDAGDHPPITPLGHVGEPKFTSTSEARLYEYVVCHFLATLMGNCVYELRTIQLDLAGERFTLTSSRPIDPGFTEVFTWQQVTANENSLPATVNVGDRWNVVDLLMDQGQTSPPDHLTETELITLMERHGIGTDASIPVHINNICQRNYVTVQESSRRLVPTQLGVILVHGYWKIDCQLVEAEMRSAIEHQLMLIADGQANPASMKEHILDIFTKKFHYFVENVALMDALFEDTFQTLADSGKPFSRCGRCRRYMKIVLQGKKRLFCATCQLTYPLPRGSTISFRPLNDAKCPLDGFDLIYCVNGGNGGDHALCPYCYSNPPFEDMRPEQACNRCTHPTCPYSSRTLAVAICEYCARTAAKSAFRGSLLLDPGSAPKWQLCCNQCKFKVRIFKGAKMVRVTDDHCPQCNSRLVHVIYTQVGLVTCWNFFSLIHIQDELITLLPMVNQRKNVASLVMVNFENCVDLNDKPTGQLAKKSQVPQTVTVAPSCKNRRRQITTTVTQIGQEDVHVFVGVVQVEGGAEVVRIDHLQIHLPVVRFKNFVHDCTLVESKY